MEMNRKLLISAVKTLVGCALFGLGFNLFLEPNGLSAGGVSGLSMVIVHLTKFSTVGIVTALINLPLFIIGGVKIGKRFFFGSLFGMVFTAIFLDLFSGFSVPDTEPLIAALYGGVICGIGVGIVFSAGFSTGGSDIVVRLLKLKYQHVPIGVFTICFDMVVALLTGLVFGDISRTLYSGVAIFVTGQVLDAVVYRFDYSKVALIITREYEEVAKRINRDLDRGATFLHGEGTYSGAETKVILTAVKRQQLADLKALVVEVDPKAFIIVQEAHQVLGDGFARYTKDAL